MFWQEITPEWQITCWYLAFFAVFALAAKMLSIGRAGGYVASDMLSFLLAPSLCMNSWAKRKKLQPGQTQAVVLRTLLLIVLLYMLYRHFVPKTEVLPWWLQSYLAIIPFWLLLETLSALCQLLWLPSGRLTSAVNNRPWLAESLTEFWGKRWNRLFGDWLHQLVFLPLRRKPQLAMGSTFFVSGLLHELLVSLPLQIVYGRAVWGWLLGYFMLQYLAIWLQRYFVSSSGLVKRIILWFAVLGPAPLVLNPGTLLIFHLGC